MTAAGGRRDPMKDAIDRINLIVRLGVFLRAGIA